MCQEAVEEGSRHQLGTDEQWQPAVQAKCPPTPTCPFPSIDLLVERSAEESSAVLAFGCVPRLAARDCFALVRLPDRRGRGCFETCSMRVRHTRWVLAKLSSAHHHGIRRKDATIVPKRVRMLSRCLAPFPRSWRVWLRMNGHERDAVQSCAGLSFQCETC